MHAPAAILFDLDGTLTEPLLDFPRIHREMGIGDRGIPACATCHGADAEGVGDFPRLAGQHAKYVEKQLVYIQSLVRAAPVMHGIVKDLAPAEITALAAYVQSR